MSKAAGTPQGTGADRLLRAIADVVDVCFANPGTTEMWLVSALDNLTDSQGNLAGKRSARDGQSQTGSQGRAVRVKSHPVLSAPPHGTNTRAACGLSCANAYGPALQCGQCCAFTRPCARVPRMGTRGCASAPRWPFCTSAPAYATPLPTSTTRVERAALSCAWLAIWCVAASKHGRALPTHSDSIGCHAQSPCKRV